MLIEIEHVSFEFQVELEYETLDFLLCSLKDIEMEDSKCKNQMHEEEGALTTTSWSLHKPKSILSTLGNTMSLWIRLGLGLLFLLKIKGCEFAAVGRFGFRAGRGIWIRVGSLFLPCFGFVWVLGLWDLCCCVSFYLTHFNMELECEILDFQLKLDFSWLDFKEQNRV